MDAKNEKKFSKTFKEKVFNSLEKDEERAKLAKALMERASEGTTKK